MSSNPFETTDRNLYGAHETNGLVDGAAYHAQVDYSQEGRMTLKQVAAAGGKITRLRILTEYVPELRQRLCDISYCNATLPDGRTVNVYDIGVNNLTPMRDMMGALIQWAKEEGVYAKGLGLLDKGNWSVL